MNCYIVHNLNAEDRVRIITSKWWLGQDPLLIQVWKLNFKPTSGISEEITTLWIKNAFATCGISFTLITYRNWKSHRSHRSAGYKQIENPRTCNILLNSYLILPFNGKGS